MAAIAVNRLRDVSGSLADSGLEPAPPFSHLRSPGNMIITLPGATGASPVTVAAAALSAFGASALPAASTGVFDEAGTSEPAATGPVSALVCSAFCSLTFEFSGKD